MENIKGKKWTESHPALTHRYKSPGQTAGLQEQPGSSQPEPVNNV